MDRPTPILDGQECCRAVARDQAAEQWRLDAGAAQRPASHPQAQLQAQVGLPEIASGCDQTSHSAWNDMQYEPALRRSLAGEDLARVPLHEREWQRRRGLGAMGSMAIGLMM